MTDFKCLPLFSPLQSHLSQLKNPEVIGIFKTLVTGALGASPASPSLAQALAGGGMGCGNVGGHAWKSSLLAHLQSATKESVPAKFTP